MGARQTPYRSRRPSAHTQDCSGGPLQDMPLRLPSDSGLWKQGPHTDHSDQEGSSWCCTRETTGCCEGSRGCSLQKTVRKLKLRVGGKPSPFLLGKSYESCLPVFSPQSGLSLSHLQSVVLNNGLGVSAPWGTAWGNGKRMKYGSSFQSPRCSPPQACCTLYLPYLHNGHALSWSSPGSQDFT